MLLVRDNYYSKRRSQIHSIVLDILNHLDMMMNQTEKFLSSSTETIKTEIIKKEETINKYEEKIERYILEIVSLEQLDTSEIKWIFSISRIIRELERVGDQIINVINMSDIFDKQEIQPRVERFFNYEKKMIHFLYEGLLKDNIEQLNKTIHYDRYVNKLEKETLDDMMDVIKEKNSFTEGKLKIVMISRFLERIGDHLANAAKAHKRSIKYSKKINK